MLSDWELEKDTTEEEPDEAEKSPRKLKRKRNAATRLAWLC